jgi:hypothetical protein
MFSSMILSHSDKAKGESVYLPALKQLKLSEVFLSVSRSALRFGLMDYYGSHCRLYASIRIFSLVPLAISINHNSRPPVSEAVLNRRYANRSPFGLQANPRWLSTGDLVSGRGLVPSPFMAQICLPGVQFSALRKRRARTN